MEELLAVVAVETDEDREQGDDGSRTRPGQQQRRPAGNERVGAEPADGREQQAERQRPREGLFGIRADTYVEHPAREEGVNDSPEEESGEAGSPGDPHQSE